MVSPQEARIERGSTLRNVDPTNRNASSQFEGGRELASINLSANLSNLSERYHTHADTRARIGRQSRPTAWDVLIERVKGVEPSSSAWKAEVLAIELHPLDVSELTGSAAHERSSFANDAKLPQTQLVR